MDILQPKSTSYQNDIQPNAFEKIDNIEYIDQAATPQDATKLTKGYHTLDSDNDANRANETEVQADEDVFKTPQRSQKVKVKGKTSSGKKKGKKVRGRLRNLNG